MRPARWVFLKRVLPAAVCFAVVQESLLRAYEWDLRSWVTRHGEAAGCGVMRSGPYFIGRSGPFIGEDLKHDAWNFAWRHVGLAVSSAAGLGAAAGVYTVCACGLGRTRLFGYRGPTRCGVCGYALAGLTEPRCPECGRAI